jgi:hypothetical protein
MTDEDWTSLGDVGRVWANFGSESGFWAVLGSAIAPEIWTAGADVRSRTVYRPAHSFMAYRTFSLILSLSLKDSLKPDVQSIA